MPKPTRSKVTLGAGKSIGVCDSNTDEANIYQRKVRTMQTISPASIVNELIESAAMLVDIPLKSITHKAMWKSLTAEEVRITECMRQVEFTENCTPSVSSEYRGWKRTVREVCEIIHEAEMS